MGCAKAKVRITNPKLPSKYRESEPLADTGGVYTIVSAESLADIESFDKMEFCSIGNQKLIREVGVSVIEIRGRRWLTNVILGDERDTEVLGVTTLGRLGLQIDP